MIQRSDRSSLAVTSRHNWHEKNTGNLIEAHDWMGPDNFSEVDRWTADPENRQSLNHRSAD